MLCYWHTVRYEGYLLHSLQNTAECTIEYWVDSENILLCVIHYYITLLEYEMNTSLTSVDVNYFAEYCRVYI